MCSELLPLQSAQQKATKEGDQHRLAQARVTGSCHEVDLDLTIWKQIHFLLSLQLHFHWRVTEGAHFV